MSESNFYYSDGLPLQKHDHVLIDRTQYAWVEEVLIPGTQKAHDYACPEGGFILRFQDGGIQVWPYPDEDICLIERGQDTE